MLIDNFACLCTLSCSIKYKVVLGAHSLSQAEDKKQTFDMAAVYNHPDYNKENYDNDIALVKVTYRKSGYKLGNEK